MYMYKEDFENILRKQRPSPKGFIYFATCNSTSPRPRITTRNLVIFFKSRSIKKKGSTKTWNPESGNGNGITETESRKRKRKRKRKHKRKRKQKRKPNTESNISDRKLKNFTLHNLVQSKENLS